MGVGDWLVKLRVVPSFGPDWLLQIIPQIGYPPRFPGSSHSCWGEGSPLQMGEPRKHGPRVRLSNARCPIQQRVPFPCTTKHANMRYPAKKWPPMRKAVLPCHEKKKLRSSSCLSIFGGKPTTQQKQAAPIPFPPLRLQTKPQLKGKDLDPTGRSQMNQTPTRGIHLLSSTKPKPQNGMSHGPPSPEFSSQNLSPGARPEPRALLTEKPPRAHLVREHLSRFPRCLEPNSPTKNIELHFGEPKIPKAEARIRSQGELEIKVAVPKGGNPKMVALQLALA